MKLSRDIDARIMKQLIPYAKNVQERKAFKRALLEAKKEFCNGDINNLPQEWWYDHIIIQLELDRQDQEMDKVSEDMEKYKGDEKLMGLLSKKLDHIDEAQCILSRALSP